MERVGTPPVGSSAAVRAGEAAVAPKLPRDTPGPVPSRLTPLNGSRHPRAHSSSTSDTSTVTTEPTRTKQAPGHSLTGRRETQTAERREKERERGGESGAEMGFLHSLQRTGEKHWRGDAHGVEAMGGEGATVTLAKPQGHFTTGTAGGDPHLPQPCPNKPCKRAVPDGHKGFRATRSPLWLVSTWMQFIPRHGCSASGPGCWTSPVLPAQRL